MLGANYGAALGKQQSEDISSQHGFEWSPLHPTTHLTTKAILQNLTDMHMHIYTYLYLYRDTYVYIYIYIYV